MGDTSNWEFAAAVAAVAIGLGGLLLITIIGAVGSWRVYARAQSAVIEAEKASVLVQEAARPQRGAEITPAFTSVQTAGALDSAAESLTELRARADALIEQQQHLQEAVRNLIEAGVLRAEGANQSVTEIQTVIKRIEEHLSEIAAAVVNLSVQG